MGQFDDWRALKCSAAPEKGDGPERLRCYRLRVRARTLLTPLLPTKDQSAGDSSERDRLRQALLADPALAGRVARVEAGAIMLTGPGGGPPPASLKERRRWELHVRLRLVAEFGEAAASRATIRWICI